MKGGGNIMPLSSKIKKFRKEEHTLKEHLDFIYTVLYEIADMLEEIEADSHPKTNNSTLDEIRIKL